MTSEVVSYQVVLVECGLSHSLGRSLFVFKDTPPTPTPPSPKIVACFVGTFGKLSEKSPQKTGVGAAFGAPGVRGVCYRSVTVGPLSGPYGVLFTPAAS